MTAKFKKVVVSIPSTGLLVDAHVASQINADWRLICIPGSPSQPFLFKRLLNLASENLEIVVVNRLGYGKDDEDPVLDFSEQAKIVEPF